MIFAAGLIMALLTAAPLRADYVVTRYDGTTVTAPSYWIQNDKLYLSNSTEPMSAYAVKDIAAQNLTPAEIKDRDDAMEVLHAQALELLSKETDLALAQAQALSRIAGYPVGRKNAIPRKDRKALKAELAARKGKVSSLLADWKNLRLPDLSLVKMRDIKVLQLYCLHASMEQAIRFVDKNDPSNFEHSKADLGQYAAFDETFREAFPWK